MQEQYKECLGLSWELNPLPRLNERGSSWRLQNKIVLKKTVQKPGHFQYTNQYKRKSCSCPWDKFFFTSVFMHFLSIFNMFL